MIKPLYIIVIISFLSFLDSCQERIVEINEWSPELVTPIVNATITIEDLIPEKGTTEYDNNNLIHLAFRSDTVYVLPPEFLLDVTGLNLDTLVTLEQLALDAQNNPSVAPLINLLGLEIPFPESQLIPGALFSLITADIIDPFNFQFDEFSNASFNSGQLVVEITNHLPVSIDSTSIQLIPGSDIEWNIDIIDLNPGEIATQTIDLTGLVIAESNNIEVIINTLQIENVGADMVEITPQTGFEVSFSLSNVGFQNITLPLGGDTVDVDLALFEDFDSGLILENPRFTLKVDNPFILSGSLDGVLLAFSQYNTQESLLIDLDILPNTTSTVTYYVDQIGDIIALPPQTLEYEASANISFNSDDLIGTDPLQLGVDIDFPLSVNAANLSLTDTIIFDGINYDISQIKNMSVHYNRINGFPLGTEFNLILHDSLDSSNNLDTLNFLNTNNSESNIIAPAIVDETGEVIESVISSGILTLKDLTVNNFLNTNKIIVDVKLSSSGFQDDNQYVKIYSDHECLFKVGLETEINID